MKALSQDIVKFLSNGEYRIAPEQDYTFVFIAQNQSALIFGIEVSDGINEAVRESVAALIEPFQSKSFGPKTMEMYVLYICDRAASPNEIERCERDVRVCRKLVISEISDVSHRLSFLTPFNFSISSVPDPEELFWNAIGEELTPEDQKLLKSMKETPIELWSSERPGGDEA